jgi:zinc transporter, ZIP family
VALSVSVTPRTLGLLMGFGAGALIGAVAFELVAEAGRLGGGSGRVAAGLLVGSLLYLVASGQWPRTAREEGESARDIAVVVIPEAVIIVGSLLAGHGVGIAVITAVFLCGVPEAIAVTGRLRTGGMEPARVMGLWATLALVCGVAAWVTYALLRDADPGAVAFVLAVAGGSVLTGLTTVLVPEGHHLAGPFVGPAATFGFALVFGLVEVA